MTSEMPTPKALPKNGYNCSLMATLSFLRKIQSFHMDHHMKEVVRGAATAFVLKVVGAGLGFGFNVLLARLLGAEGVGVYYLALTVTTIASVVGRVGLDNALLRFIAVSAVQGDWNKVAGVYRRGIWITTVVSTVSTLFVVGSASWIAQSIFSEPTLAAPLRLIALGILPLSLLILYAEMLKGLKKTSEAVLVQSIGVPLISIPLLVLLGGPFGVVGAVIAYVLATILVLLLGIGMWRRATPQIRSLRGDFDVRRLISTSLPLFWVASMNLVMSWTDTVMLGIWMDSKTVGIYGIAMRTAMLTSFILVSVNSIIAPKFAALYAQGESKALGSLACNAAKLTTLLAAPLLLLFIVAPTWVLKFFGPDFITGATVLSILSIGQFVNVVTGSVGYLLMMSGYEKLMRNNIMASAALNVALNAMLIPKYGLSGAAIATAVSLAMMNIVSVGLVYWKLSIITVPILKGVFIRGR